MKPLKVYFTMLTFSALLFAVGCKPKDTPADAAANDTTQTFMRHKDDKTGIRTDTAQVELPQKDSVTPQR